MFHSKAVQAPSLASWSSLVVFPSSSPGVVQHMKWTSAQLKSSSLASKFPCKSWRGLHPWQASSPAPAEEEFIPGKQASLQQLKKSSSLQARFTCSSWRRFHPLQASFNITTKWTTIVTSQHLLRTRSRTTDQLHGNVLVPWDAPV